MMFLSRFIVITFWFSSFEPFLRVSYMLVCESRILSWRNCMPSASMPWRSGLSPCKSNLPLSTVSDMYRNRLLPTLVWWLLLLLYSLLTLVKVLDRLLWGVTSGLRGRSVMGASSAEERSDHCFDVFQMILMSSVLRKRFFWHWV